MIPDAQLSENILQSVLNNEPWENIDGMRELKVKSQAAIQSNAINIPTSFSISGERPVRLYRQTQILPTFELHFM
jgi:hypothetical protein